MYGQGADKHAHDPGRGAGDARGARHRRAARRRASDRGTDSSIDRRLAELIETAGPVAITEPVVMEVLAGARDDGREADLRRMLLRFELLGFEAVSDFDGAVRIYRRCRAAGITPRGMVNCMIAAVAWRRGATLLAHDADMGRVAGVIGIEIDPASLQA